MKKNLKGLIAAVFTPMNDDCSLNLNQVPNIVDHLLRNQVSGFYVCGSTGEGSSLTSEERRAVAQAYVEATNGRVPVIIQVGHNSLTEACKLAEHAQEIGADAISAVPPSYFGIHSLEILIDCLEKVACVVPDMPFYYYHLSALTGVNFDMIEFLRMANERMPNFEGIKYSNITVHEYQACLEFQNGKFTILFGCDEMLSCGLSVGAKGAVGSTYNFAAPLYRQIIDAFNRGDVEQVKQKQYLSVAMVRIYNHYRGQPGIKAAMKLIGLDCGPNRLPHKTLSGQEIEALKKELEAINFWDWALESPPKSHIVDIPEKPARAKDKEVKI